MAAYGAAIRRKPGFAEAHYNLGITLYRRGERDSAATCFVAALALRPQFVLARLNLATLRHESGEFRKAARLYREVLAQDPQGADALGNLGQALGRILEDGSLPLVWLGRARMVAPTDAPTLANLGALHEDALLGGRYLRQALVLAPAVSASQLSYGNRLREFGRWSAAQRPYRRALWLGGGAVALVNLGLLALDLGNGREADLCYRRSLALDPALGGAHRGEAELRHRQGRIGQSRVSACRALALCGHDAGAENDLANALLGLGQAAAACVHFRRAVDLNVKDERFHSNLLFSLCYDSSTTAAALFAEAQRWGERRGSRPPLAGRRLANSAEPERRLRVGYLSADFRDHPVGNNVLGLLEHHDRRTVAVFCYAELRAGSDHGTERFRALDLTWRTVTGQSDEAVAAIIQADGIDVLVTLAGHTGHNRLGVAACRPAPVQVSFHDVTTSGLASMNAWLSDGVLHPSDAAERFTEALVRLPCFYLHRPPDPSPAVVAPPQLHRGHVTFGSCNNPAKLGDQVVATWASILRSVAGSRLLLKYKNWFSDPAVQEHFGRRFVRHGVAAERLQFAGGDLPRAEQLAILNQIDIALDPFPFNGSTTTFEALWMGVPVVSLAGERFAGRVGASVLPEVGLGDLVATTTAGYSATAVALAAEPQHLMGLRTGLRGRLLASRLCDAPAHAAAVEAAYRMLWRGWCARPDR